MRLQISAFELAQRFVGLREVSGPVSNAHILAMLRLDNDWVADDSTPWCSAWVNYVAWLLRLPRSKSLAARSWLGVGVSIPLELARPGFDVVVLRRGGATEPGPEIMAAPGHVGFFAGLEGVGSVEVTGDVTFRTADSRSVLVLGGNQADQVSVASYPAGRVLGVRRLLVEGSA